MGERVSVAIDGHVAEVILDRPEKFNALDLEMFRALDDAARGLESRAGLRAVVLYGAGNNFCAGIDLDVLQSGSAETMQALLAPVGDSGATLAQRAAHAWRALPVPVICALRGFAFGGGFQIAMGADLRVAAPDTTLSIMEAKWGLIPDMAISTSLRHILAPDVIKELAFSARVIDANEALRLGVITRIEQDPVDAARELAKSIAAKSPDAIRGIKRLINEAWAMSEKEALELEAQIQKDVLSSPNLAEAIRANLDKRPPEFFD